MPGSKIRSSYKRKVKGFYGVGAPERDREREVNTQRAEQSKMTTIVVPNETNSKASEFPISVSKRKLDHEMTQQQYSKRQMIEYTSLTDQPTLAAVAAEPQHLRISNRLLKMQIVKLPKS